MTYFLSEMDLLKLETERRFGGLEIRFKWRRSGCVRKYSPLISHIYTHTCTNTQVYSRRLRRLQSLTLFLKQGVLEVSLTWKKLLSDQLKTKKEKFKFSISGRVFTETGLINVQL